jgi:hypothetical protein
MFTAIQKIIHSWHDLPVTNIVLCGGDADRNHGQNASYLYLWYTSHPENSVCTCNWALLHCCQNIISMPSLFTFFIHLWEWTSVLQSSVYVLRYSVKWITSLALHHSSSTISIAGTVCETHVSVFFIYKSVSHFGYDHTATQHSLTSLESVQAGTTVLTHFISAQLVNVVELMWAVEQAPKVWPHYVFCMYVPLYDSFWCWSLCLFIYVQVIFWRKDNAVYIQERSLQVENKE